MIKLYCQACGQEHIDNLTASAITNCSRFKGTSFSGMLPKSLAAPSAPASNTEAVELLREVFDDRGCRVVNHDGSRTVTPEWVKRIGEVVAGRSNIGIPVDAAPSAPAHTDHPLRNFDRTCPGCIAEHTPYTNEEMGLRAAPSAPGGETVKREPTDDDCSPYDLSDSRHPANRRRT